MNNNDPFISRQIDLNLNIGQGFGEENLDKELLNYATSANVSTGAHAGDPACIERAIKACKEHESLSLGALVSYPDLLGYGMRKIQLSNEELRACILSQLGSLAALAKSHGYELSHVRPHGYLYHQISTNYSVAETLAKSVQEFSKWLILVGPGSSVLEEVGSWTNVRVAFEARYDLRYRHDGTLISYEATKDSNIDLELATERARDLVYKSSAKTEEGKEVDVKFESIHISSKIKNAVEIAKLVRGMILKPLALKTVDYEPYLSEFV